MSLKKDKVLIIAPHADDEVLGCGGYISKFNNIKDFYVLVLTNSHLGSPNLYSQTDIQNIRDEAKKASKYLKIKKIFFENFPGTKLDIFPGNEISDKIFEYIKSIKPKEVFLPFYNDTHSDHQKIYSSSLVALRPFILKKIITKKIFCYETLSETEFGIPDKKNFDPNYFVSLNEKDFKNKVEAFKFYKSQIKKFPNPRSIPSIKIQAQFRGIQSNSLFSEAFRIIRMYE